MTNTDRTPLTKDELLALMRAWKYPTILGKHDEKTSLA
jgi:hypothetical protein